MAITEKPSLPVKENPPQQQVAPPVKIPVQISQQPKERMLPELAEISIWLDTYDDVFSDFDPRPYTQRTMSDDFIHAAKKEVKETSGGKLQMILMIPVALRVTAHEETIKKRVRDYFKSNFDTLSKRTRYLQRWGYIIFAGAITSIFISSMVHYLQAPIIVQNLLYSIFEPMGFFMLFTGLEQVISAGKNKENIDFYRRIAEGTIKFIGY